ncbi:MAG: hypothetical protein HC900_08025 [Methylacidiphilales bacterium]|nr:hypothetical protein [Candidatus Methylacidiphilales bacterium]
MVITEGRNREVRKLFEAVIQAPTSFNIQHWRFVILRDAALRAKIFPFEPEPEQRGDADLHHRAGQRDGAHRQQVLQ